MSGSRVELRDLVLETDIGTYGADDVVPDAHILDLALEIASDLVLIDSDGMEHVFDYDPLIAEIDRLARDGHYATQERLITRIAHACAQYPEIAALEVCLRKRPVLRGTGELGLRLSLEPDALERLRAA